MSVKPRMVKSCQVQSGERQELCCGGLGSPTNVFGCYPKMGSICRMLSKISGCLLGGGAYVHVHICTLLKNDCVAREWIREEQAWIDVPGESFYFCIPSVCTFSRVI